MAAKENQGLQAAVIAFFILAVILAVTTYLGFSTAQENNARAETSAKNAADSNAALSKAMNDFNELKIAVGYPAEEEAANIKSNYEKDLQIYAAQELPEGQRAYRPLISNLDTTLKNRDQQLAQAKTDLDNYRSETEANLAAMKADLAKAQQAMQEKTQELENERNKFNTDRNTVNQQLVQAQGELQKAKEQIAALEAKYSKITSDLTQRNERLASQNKGYQAELDQVTTTSFEVPDGKVTWVAQRGQTVYLNLGTRDGLRSKVTFSVYDPDQVNVENAKAKAKIEIVGTPGVDSAEARIIEQDLRNPVLPNDLIYSPIWHRGRQQHVALAGAIDVNGDGKSDRQHVIDIIRMNGGVVDAYVDDSGKVIGKLTPETKYLIVGPRPELGSGAVIDPSLEADLRNLDILVTQAQDLGVPQIPLQKFLDNMGYAYSSLPRGEVSDRPAPESEAEGGQFRPRRPPTRGTEGGAF